MDFAKVGLNSGFTKECEAVILLTDLVNVILYLKIKNKTIMISSSWCHNVAQ